MKRKKTYKSGLRIVVDSNKSKNVAFQIWYGVGSAHEKPSEYGLAHFLEHLTFKSTKKRTTNQIAEDCDFLGTSLNASTAFLKTSYYFVSTKENFQKSLEVFSDMILDNVWNQEEINTERNVILEEMKMYYDRTKTKLAVEVGNAFRNKTPFNHGIIGETEVVKNIDIKKIIAFKEKHYTQNNIIISIAGGVSYWKAKRLVKKYFPDWLKGNEKPKQRLEFKADNPIKKHFLVCPKDENHVNVLITIKGIEYENPQYHTQTFLTKILSSGMSSRFYANLREKQGLVYSINSSTFIFADAGEIEISFGTSNDKLKTAMQEIRKIMEDIATNGITDFELQKVKNKVKANFALKSQTSNLGRTTNNANDLFYGRKIRKMKQVLKIVNNITKQDIQNFAKQILEEKNFVVGAIGKDININDLKVFKK